MLLYTNGFRFAISSDAMPEIIINFLQKKPVINNDGEVIDTSIEEVASVVMQRDTAEHLLEALSVLLNNSKCEN